MKKLPATSTKKLMTTSTKKLTTKSKVTRQVTANRESDTTKNEYSRIANVFIFSDKQQFSIW